MARLGRTAERRRTCGFIDRSPRSCSPYACPSEKIKAPRVGRNLAAKRASGFPSGMKCRESTSAPESSWLQAFHRLRGVTCRCWEPQYKGGGSLSSTTANLPARRCTKLVSLPPSCSRTRPCLHPLRTLSASNEAQNQEQEKGTAIIVSDVDRAKAFYEKAEFRLDSRPTPYTRACLRTEPNF